jgi:DNA-binding transcriptional regulator YiaG
MKFKCDCQDCDPLAPRLDEQYPNMHFTELGEYREMMRFISLIMGFDDPYDVMMMADHIAVLISKKGKSDPIWKNQFKWGLVRDGKDLKAWRIKHLMTADSAAAALCVSIATIRSMESGRAKISKQVQRMCQLINERSANV